MYNGGAERLDIALALQGLLIGVHGVRSIDRQHEGDVDISTSPFAWRQQDARPDSQRDGK